MVLFISIYLFYSLFKSLILLRMMKVILTLGALYLLNLTNAPEVLKTISLVRRIGTINVAKSTRLTPIAMTISTGKNDDPLEKWLTDSLEKLKTVLSIPGILGSEEHLSNYASQSAGIESSLNDSIKYVQTISKYRGPGIPVPETVICAGQIADNIKGYVFQTKETLTNSYGTLNLQWSKTDILPGTAAYSTLINFYNDVRSSVQDLESNLGTHLQMLESLTSGQVTPHLTAKIQELSCVPAAEFDKIQLDNCIKVDTGLYCTFYISTFTATTIYKRYIPVNYRGVVVKIPPQNIVVKSSETDEQGLLHCERAPTAAINSCSFQIWDPIKHIFERDPLLAIQNCNFTFAEIPLPLQTYDYSVFIMDPQLEIAINPSQGAPPIQIDNMSPMIVSLFKDSFLSLDKDRLHLSFKGALQTDTFRIQVSIFNESLLNLMYEKAMKQTFGEINWDTVFKYGMAILQMVVAPTAVFTCGISFYAIMRSICRRKRSRKIYDSPLRRNYYINKSHSLRTPKSKK